MELLTEHLITTTILGILLGYGLAYWFLRHHIARHVYEEGFKAGWKECQTWMTDKIVVTEETINGL